MSKLWDMERLRPNTKTENGQGGEGAKACGAAETEEIFSVPTFLPTSSQVAVSAHVGFANHPLFGASLKRIWVSCRDKVPSSLFNPGFAGAYVQACVARAFGRLSR